MDQVKREYSSTDMNSIVDLLVTVN